MLLVPSHRFVSSLPRSPVFFFFSHRPFSSSVSPFLFSLALRYVRLFSTSALSSCLSSFSLSDSTPLRLIIHTSESHPLLQRHTSGTDSMAHHFIDLLSPLSQVSTRIFHRFMQASPAPLVYAPLHPDSSPSPINRSGLRVIREDPAIVGGEIPRRSLDTSRRFDSALRANSISLLLLRYKPLFSDIPI